MNNKQKLSKLRLSITNLYKKDNKDLLFHGFHHIEFVVKKSLIFCKTIKADTFIVESAALTHDLNYLVKKNSSAAEGKDLRTKLLKQASYVITEIDRIEKIVTESSTANRHAKISKESMALSDADTLFKSLPITPIVFASRYIKENNIDIKKLARKVTSEQNKLMKAGIYFYTKIAREKYLDWAKTNLKLWNNVEISLRDVDVTKLLDSVSRF